MAIPNTGVCSPFATTADLCSPCSDYSVDAALLEDMLDIASDLLFELLGRRFSGSCTETVRPCGRSYAESANPPYLTGEGHGRAIWNGSGCHCSPRRCGCSRVPEVTLGGYPITAITSVRVDGAVVDASEYRIDDNRWLVRLNDADDNNEGWPCCQDMLADPLTDDDTFQVTYTYGVPAPPAVVHATAVLACELAIACDPPDGVECRLPSRVQEVTREGVSFLMAAEEELGILALPEVKAVIQAYNPKRIQQRARVLSSSMRKRVRRAGT